MSVEQSALVWKDRNLKGAPRWVLLAMADEAASNGELSAYRRSQSWIATKTMIHPETVRNAIRALAKAGYLEVTKKGTGRKSSDYKLTIAEGSIRAAGEDGEVIASREAPPLPEPKRGPVSDCPSESEGDQIEGQSETGPAPTSDCPSPSDKLAQGQSGTHPHHPVLPVPPRSQPTSAPPQAADGIDFDQFWAKYPKKKDKGAARKAWAKAVKHTSPDKIMAGLASYVIETAGRSKQFVKYPATWLNAESWDNEPDEPTRPVGPRGLLDHDHKPEGRVEDL